MNIAVCMSGQPRGVRKRWNSFYDHFLSHLPNYDLFIHTSKQFDVDCDFFSTLNPKMYCVEEQIRHPKMEELLEPFFYNELRLDPYIQQIYGYKRVWQLKDCYEQSNNIKYDLVIRCRPDIKYLSPLKLEHFDIETINQLPNKKGLSNNYWNNEHNEWMSDIFIIGPSQQMSYVMNIYDWIRDNASLLNHDNPWLRRANAEHSEKQVTYWAEAILSFCLREHGLRLAKAKVYLEDVLTKFEDT